MRRSGIVRLNLIKILCAASNACLNLAKISPIAANLLADCACKFYSFARILFGSRTLRCTPRFKTERERLKFHGAVYKRHARQGFDFAR